MNVGSKGSRKPLGPRLTGGVRDKVVGIPDGVGWIQTPRTVDAINLGVEEFIVRLSKEIVMYEFMEEDPHLVLHHGGAGMIEILLLSCETVPDTTDGWAGSAVGREHWLLEECGT